MQVNRNVILDLLPVYIAGEASEETKTLVEKFAENDKKIADMIDNGAIEFDLKSIEIAIPDNLEMKAIERVQKNIRRKMIFVALITATILLIPFIAMAFTNEVNWKLMDFIVMGTMLFCTGAVYVVLSKFSEDKPYLIGAGVALFSGFLLIWINLAVGIIGSEGNPANLLFFGVILIGIVFAISGKFTPSGMAKAMFFTASSQVAVPFIALIIWKSSMETSPGIMAIFAINAVFALLFGISSWLFKAASKNH